MYRHTTPLLFAAVLATLLVVPAIGASEPIALESKDRLPTLEHLVEESQRVAMAAAQEVGDVVDDTAGQPGGDGEDGEKDAAPPGNDDGRLGDGLIGSLTSPGGIALLTALGLVGLVGGGFLLATRYVDPKEALDNPQRAMLYGCIKGHPGVNLKQLSEDFDMKTSTVLWHIRKLEGAELVRSQKANGLRVFYPVSGGVEAKNLGAAVAALTNDNASKILDYVTIHPGTAQKGLVNALAINAGTVRWHLRKLKEVGLMAELSQGRTSTYYPTELGLKALRQTLGLSQDVKPVPEIVAQATASP